MYKDTNHYFFLYLSTNARRNA